MPNIMTLIPEPIPSKAMRSWGRTWPCSSPMAIVIGRATEPVFPNVSKVVKSSAGSSLSVSSRSLRWARPTWWQKVLVCAAGGPPDLVQELGECLPGGRDAFVEQGLGIGRHEQSRLAGLGDAAFAQATLPGVRPGDASPKPVARPAQPAVDQQDRGAGGADGEGRHGGLDVGPGKRLVGIQSPDRAVQEGPAVFGPHDQSGADAAQLDHVGHLQHAAQEAQAGVGDVVHGTLAGQTEPPVYDAGRGRLEEVAAHRAVYHRADVTAVQAGGQDAFSAVARRPTWPSAVGPEPPPADAAHQLQAALG